MGFLNHHRPLTIPPRKAGPFITKQVTSRGAKSIFLFQEKHDTQNDTQTKPPGGAGWVQSGFLIVFLSGKKREEEFQRKMQSIMEKPRELAASV